MVKITEGCGESLKLTNVIFAHEEMSLGMLRSNVCSKILKAAKANRKSSDKKTVSYEEMAIEGKQYWCLINQ